MRHTRDVRSPATKMSGIVLVLASASFFNPTLRLRESGRSISLHGTGSPIVFSSGLFGLMPRRIYTRLMERLSANATIVVVDDAVPVTSALVDDVATTIGVDRVGFFAHSSMDADILSSHRVHSAVLCDPVVLPTVESIVGTRRFDPPFPVLKVQSELAYTVEPVGIPEYISPHIAQCRSTIIRGVGHADLLDDTWADLGPRVLPWMRGATTPPVSFGEWTFRRQTALEKKVRTRRAAYREEVGNRALRHLLSSAAESVPDGVLVDVQKSAAD